MIPLRRAIARGTSITIGDIEAILDAAEAFPEDARLRLVLPHMDDEADANADPERPWATEWTGVAVNVHGAEILVPVVGEWPFGAERHADDIDVRTLVVTDLIAPLRAVTTVIHEASESGARFIGQDESMERIMAVLMAHAQTDHPELVAYGDEHDEGVVLCEVAMDEHGLPILFVENSNGPIDVDIDHGKRLAIARLEPLCMVASSFETQIDGVRTSRILLSPVHDEMSLETIETTSHDALGVIRTLNDHAAALKSAGIPAYDENQERDA